MLELKSRPKIKGTLLNTNAALGEFKIKECLYSGKEQELYLLDETQDSRTLALCCRSGNNKTKRVMNAGNRLLNSRAMTSLEEFELSDTELEVHVQVLKISGHPLSELSPDKDAELNKTLLITCTELVQKSELASAEGIQIVFDPATIYAGINDNGTTISTLIYEELGVDFERRAISSCGALLFEFATKQTAKAKPKQDLFINKFNPNVSSKLSAIIASMIKDQTCFSFTQVLDQLSTLPKERLIKTAAMPQAKGFAKIGGMEQFKQFLENELISVITNPEEAAKYGLRMPNGLLLYGPPGCGKTFIARAIADEINLHLPTNKKKFDFIEATPSSIASKFIWGAVEKIGNLFEEAEKRAPCILFIDEFDAMAPKREDLQAMQQHTTQEVNELLSRLEGAASKGILVVAATNHPDKLDEAVRRSGRLDFAVFVPPPDQTARQEILRLRLKSRPLESLEDLDSFAAGLVGYSASDLSLIAETASKAAFREDALIALRHLQQAALNISPSLRNQIHAEAKCNRGIDGAVDRPEKDGEAKGFSCIAGMRTLLNDLSISILNPLVSSLVDPELMKRYRISPPNGLLFSGPPGCGKTYVARALADEINLRVAEALGVTPDKLPPNKRFKFEEVSPSKLGSMYMHGSSKLIADLFTRAESKAPCLVFIDEFEAIVPARDSLGNQQAEEVNEFLVSLESCAKRGIFFVAATNLPHKIDAAVMRTGRLDFHFEIPAPDAVCREQILRLHLSERPLASEISDKDSSLLRKLADSLEFYSASDIALLVNKAAYDAALTQANISLAHLEAARMLLKPSLLPSSV